MEFSADAFNMLNTVNYKDFVGEIGWPFFGRANPARPARTFPLGLRVRF